MKLKMLLPFVGATIFAIVAACSNADSVSSPEESTYPIGKGNSLTRADSSKVIVYTYEEFTTGDEVSILKSDTSEISVDIDFAAKADSLIPQPGNVLVIWEKMLSEPYYLRVVDIMQEDNRYKIAVKQATPFDAIPSGDYNLSSEIYVDPNAVPNGGKLTPDAFYNKESNTFHPFLITEEEQMLESNEELLQGKVLGQNSLNKTLAAQRYIDLRDIKFTSGSIDQTVIDIQTEFHPGVIGVPGMGAAMGDYQGSWLNAFGGIEKLDKAFDKNGGKNPDGSPIKAYVRMDTLKFAAKVDFHLSWTTDWGIKGFEFYIKGTKDIYISDFGMGLGAAYSGEKKLTDFTGKGFTFYVYGVPVYVKIIPNLYLKYGWQAYALLDYRLKYTKHSEAAIGLSWKSGDGVTLIKQGSATSSYNKASSLGDFIYNSHALFCGGANTGIYFRVAALLYNVVGPTVGIGFRLNLNAELGTAASYDDNGNWVGIGTIPTESFVELDGSLAVEAGAEVSLLGYTLFSKSYDVYDITKKTIFRLEAHEGSGADMPEYIIPDTDPSHRIPGKDGPLNFSSSSRGSWPFNEGLSSSSSK